VSSTAIAGVVAGVAIWSACTALMEYPTGSSGLLAQVTLAADAGDGAAAIAASAQAKRKGRRVTCPQSLFFCYFATALVANNTAST
jgi:hypothetical protein